MVKKIFSTALADALNDLLRNRDIIKNVKAMNTENQKLITTRYF